MYVCICSTDESFIDLHFSVFVVEFEKTEKKTKNMGKKPYKEINALHEFELWKKLTYKYYSNATFLV